jgi:hypothetical protein
LGTYLDLWTLLIAYGVTFGLMNDKAWWLTDRLRALRFRVQKDDQKETTFFDRMLLCPYCTGFHAGWVIWLARVLEAGTWPVPVNGTGSAVAWGVVGNVTAAVLCGFASAAFSYVLDTAAQWFESSVRR